MLVLPCDSFAQRSMSRSAPSTKEAKYNRERSAPLLEIRANPHQHTLYNMYTCEMFLYTKVLAVVLVLYTPALGGSVQYTDDSLSLSLCCYSFSIALDSYLFARLYFLSTISNHRGLG